MQLSAQTFQRLTGLIREWTGLALGPDKEYLVRHRLAPVVRAFGFGGYDELLLRLGAGQAAPIREAVIEAITTKETSFFRDAWFFDALLHHVLPELVTRRRGGEGNTHTLRICSAGASTGQEPYSLAILAHEFLDLFPLHARGLTLNITALDISGEAIDAAKTGLYSSAQVGRGVSETRLSRFFRREGDGWRVIESIRRLVQFRRFNLLHPERTLGGFDLILCRNVLIYFDPATRMQVFRSLGAALREGGWLALGSAEGIYEAIGGLDAVRMQRALLYRKACAG